MACQTRSMTEGPLARQILFFSLPLVMSNVLQVLFNMSDVAVVGRFAGAEALGAVGSTALLVALFTGLAIGMGTGINITTARFIGARHEQDVRETVHTSALLSLLLGLLLLGVGVIGARPILMLMRTKEELLDDAVRYLRLYFLGMPGLAVFNFGSAVLSASGDTRHPLRILTAAGVLNVALNLLFVIVFGMGASGVGAASAVSQTAAAVLITVFLLRRDDLLRLDIHALRLTRNKVAAVLPLGLSAGAQNAIFYLANLFVQAGVNSFPTVMVEGTAAATNADGLVYDVMAAFYTACSSFISQNYGAGKRSRILKSYLICLGYSLGIGCAMGWLLVAFGPQFLSLFTTDRDVIQAGMERLTVMGLSYGFSAFMDCTIAGSRGLGRSVAPTVMVILGSCVFRVIWIYTVFAWYGTIRSLFLLYIVSWAVTAAGELAYFIPCYRRQMRALAG